MTKVLLTGAGGSASSNVLDSLRQARRKYHVIGVDSSHFKLHLSTADERFVVPQCGGAEYLEALACIARARGVEVVHPQPDAEVLAIGRAREELPAICYLPDQTALEIAFDKAALSRTLSGAQIAVPESADIPDLHSVADVVGDLLSRHQRVWLRAKVGAGSRASLPVSSSPQALAWVTWWVEEKGLSPGDFMAAEFLPGREFAYQSIWQDGELVAGQSRERLEYLYGHLTPHGQTSTPAIARTVREPEVDALAIAAIQALGQSPRGVFCVDIKEAADGTPRVTEINAGRFFTTSNFFTAAGLNMPELLIRCALGEMPQRVGSSPLEPDLYWIRMMDMGQVLVPGERIDAWPSAHPRL